MEKELNLLDLIVMSFRAIGRALTTCWAACVHVLHMMVRYWWLFGVAFLLAIGVGLYCSRFDNLTYEANAVALINGASIQQFEQSYISLRTVQLVPENAAVRPYLEDKTITRLKTYYVIDAMADGVADYVDYDEESSATDTLEVRMKDRLGLQFRIKGAEMHKLRDIENALLAYLNSNEALRQSYHGYLANLREEVAFNHQQAQKLDSLTSYYYFNEKTVVPTLNKQNANGNVNLYVDSEVKLFLEDIYKQQQHMQQVDYRLQLATAPVVLENHFYLDPIPVNSRIKVLVFALLFAWLISYICAELMHNRKAASAWLKQ